jgi:hypothetical protein
MNTVVYVPTATRTYRSVRTDASSFFEAHLKRRRQFRAAMHGCMQTKRYFAANRGISLHKGRSMHRDAEVPALQAGGRSANKIDRENEGQDCQQSKCGCAFDRFGNASNERTTALACRMRPCSDAAHKAVYRGDGIRSIPR